MKTLYKILMPALLPLLFVQCTEDLKEEQKPQPGSQTVTLRLSAPDDDYTKTLIYSNGKVVWEEGDFILINDRYYDVMPDPENPSSAIVEGVEMADSYFAWTAEPMTEMDNAAFYAYIPDMQDCVDTTLSGRTNPMVGYTKDEVLTMHNLGAILRLGVTGDVMTQDIVITDNTGAPVAGWITVPKEDIIAGTYSDTYPDFDTTRGNASDYILLNAPTVLDPMTPTYFNIVAAPKTYTDGFTVYVRDMDGNFAIQSTYSSTELSRSTVTQKEAFAFTPAAAPLVEVANVSATSIDYEVTAQRGTRVGTVAILKSIWDQYSENTDMITSALSGWIADLSLVGAEGKATGTLKNAFAGEYFYSITPDTEYVVLTAYSNCVNYSVHQTDTVQCLTAAASGEPPVVTVSLTSDPDDFRLMSANVKTENAASILYRLMTTKAYNAASATGQSDLEIIEANGYFLLEEDLEAANVDGCPIIWNDTELVPDTEYTLLVYVLGQTGMSTVQKSTATTAVHIPAGAVWKPLTNRARMDLWMDNLQYSGNVSVEKMEGAAFYRIISPFRDDEAFTETITSDETNPATPSEMADTYLYFELVPGEFEGEYLSTFIMPLCESYIGFNIQGYELFMTNAHTGFEAGVLGGSESLEIWADTMLVLEDAMGVRYWFYQGQMALNIPLPASVSGDSIDNALSNEDFIVEESHPWQSTATVSAKTKMR